MANISSLLNKIKTATLGRDVRGSIHDGIDAINKETEATSASQKSLLQMFKNLIINAGNSNSEIAASRGDKEWLPDRLDGVDIQLAEKANKKTNVFNNETYGTFEKAAVLSAIANEAEGRVQVLGVTSVAQLSKYLDRDSVTTFLSNRSSKPITVSEGVITYSAKAVQITGITISDFSKIRPGMVIDTLHSPYRWVSLIESIDVPNQIINVKDGWYKCVEGGSTTPSTPTNNIGFEVNRTTKIWNLNTNLTLYDEDPTQYAVAWELDLLNRKTTESSVSGIDLINFINKADFGIKVRKASETAQGFGFAFMAKDSDNSYYSEANVATQNFLRSLLNGSQQQGFLVTADGTLSKLKLVAAVFSNGQKIYTYHGQRLIILNKTVFEDFSLPQPNSKSGELLFVVNYGSAKATLKTENGTGGFAINGTIVSSLDIAPRTTAIFASDNSNWHIVKGSFTNVSETFSGGTFNGNLVVKNGSSSGVEIGEPTTSGTGYIDFHSSGVNNDYDARISVTGGDGSIGGAEVDIITARLKANGLAVVTIRRGTAPPAIVPDYIGQKYVDTINKRSYDANGTNSASDWVPLN